MFTLKFSADKLKKNDSPKKHRRKGLKIRDWKIRNRVQLAFFIVTLIMGIQYYFWLGQVARYGGSAIPRPNGVDGFLPIGSLMGWKQFLITGLWEKIHPAGMVILGFAAFIAWLLRKTFCSWVCPVGTLSEWLYRLGGRLFGKNYSLYKFIDVPLRSLKYLLLAFFAFAAISMDKASLQSFFDSPYWKLADVKMLRFFTEMSVFTISVLLLLAVFSLLIKNFWCRYLCPYGALMGLFAMFSPTGIERRPDACTDCGICTKACPADLPVSTKAGILSPECTGCMECVEVCPIQDALDFKMLGVRNSFWNAKRVAIAVTGIFVFIVMAARIAGLWESQLDTKLLQTMLPGLNSVSH
ncbi:MAG: 4Fe-4S binding protein [FCB group bacterium]|nr:4Fe-4S binding protein [FCB group bacterium]